MSSSNNTDRQSLELVLRGISKRFGDVVALEPSDLVVKPGVLLSLLGPSGCGKTTTLRVIAGFEAADTGSVLIGGKDVTLLPPNKRGLGMVFQNYSLFPHMTVADNVAFGLRMEKASEQEIKRRVGEMLDLVQLPGVEKRFPNQLSGGQQQRIALARSLVTNPSVLLLDEPLGALDKNLRETMQFELRRIQNTLGITTILVTHDQEEALTLSDQVVVMDQGRFQQIGTPSEVYESPETRFVSEFLGTSNLLSGDISAPTDSDDRKVTLQYGEIKTVIESPGAPSIPAGPATVAIRPEKIVLSKRSPEMKNVLQGIVKGHVFRGSYHAYEISVVGRDDPIFVYDQAGERSADAVHPIGAGVYLAWKRENSVVLRD
jgi:putative spermidine/putrescine transport system ATP-binding protein